jgi:hemolysin D
VIEPLDPGKIAGIHVETGEAVKAGDLLLKLDPAEAGADPASARDVLDWLPEPFQLRKEAVLRADLTQLADALKDKQMAQKLATRKRLGMSIAFQNTLMETLNQRVSTRQQAIDLNVGTKINL